MRNSRNNGWEDDFVVYTEAQVESVLEYAGIEVVSDTATHFLTYCPFHGNTDSPAFAVDKSLGAFTCFNPSCLVSGNDLSELLRLKSGLNPFQALRVINKYKNESKVPFSERVREAMTKPEEFPTFSQDALDRMYEDFKKSAVAQDYMRGRGFTDETLDYFRIGYSPKQNMVTVPMHDVRGNPVGIIGRSPSKEDKRFKNSRRLPKSQTAWNIHRAKREGEAVIVCEASFDAMRIHQAGYPNVVALLGGHASADILEQLNRYFSTVVIMTDYDKKKYKPNCRACSHIKFGYNEVRCLGHRAGRDLGRSLVRGMPNKKILWATYDDTCVFPNGAKDAGDMSDEEIRQCLRNAVSNLTYELWGIENKVA